MDNDCNNSDKYRFERHWEVSDWKGEAVTSGKFEAKPNLESTNHEFPSEAPNVDELLEALKFYADRNNWTHIEGHTKWASNLKIDDCALLNCGGGRARLALQNWTKVFQPKEESPSFASNVDLDREIQEYKRKTLSYFQRSENEEGEAEYLTSVEMRGFERGLDLGLKSRTEGSRSRSPNAEQHVVNTITTTMHKCFAHIGLPDKFVNGFIREVQNDACWAFDQVFGTESRNHESHSKALDVDELARQHSNAPLDTQAKALAAIQERDWDKIRILVEDGYKAGWKECKRHLGVTLTPSSESPSDSSATEIGWEKIYKDLNQKIEAIIAEWPCTAESPSGFSCEHCQIQEALDEAQSQTKVFPLKEESHSEPGFDERAEFERAKHLVDTIHRDCCYLYSKADTNRDRAEFEKIKNWAYEAKVRLGRVTLTAEVSAEEPQKGSVLSDLEFCKNPQENFERACRYLIKAAERIAELEAKLAEGETTIDRETFEHMVRTNNEWADKARAAEKRIAELEAEIKQLKEKISGH